VVVKAAPPSSLIMIEPEFLLELLIITLNPPAQFGVLNERRDGRIRRQSRKPIFSRLVFATGPLNKKPLFSVWRRAIELEPQRSES
jgi:hypothetical protein